MKYYKVHAYNASLSELWRISGRRVLPFLVGVILKLARSPRLVFEQPDVSSAQEIPQGDLPPGVQAELSGGLEEIRACGYRLAAVQRLESGRSLSFGLFLVGPTGDRYLPLLAAVEKGQGPTNIMVRFAIVSFDSDGAPIVTTWFPPQFEPAPSAVYYVVENKGGVSALDRFHTKALETHPRPITAVTEVNLRDLVQRMEDLTYAHLRSRGIYSKKYER